MSDERLCAWCGQDLTRYALVIALHGGNANHHARRYCSPVCKRRAKRAREEARQ